MKKTLKLLPSLVVARKEYTEHIDTIYGWRRQGVSRFVFVAPHAAGDDRFAGVIARKLAEQTNGSYVVNKNFIKPTNSQASTLTGWICEFNQNNWSHKHQRYLWKDFPAKRLFYKDIAAICDSVSRKTKEKAVVVHVHGMEHDTIAVDLGVGLKTHAKTGKLETNTPGHRYSGKVTLPLTAIHLLRSNLERAIEKCNVFKVSRVGIGEIYPAYSKRMGIQFHRHEGRKDYAVQVEINKKLKNKKTLRDTFIKTFSSVLVRTFNKIT